MVDWLFGSFGGSGIRSGIPLSIHPNPFKMFGDPIGNPKPPNAPNHPLTIIAAFFPWDLRSDSFVEFPKGDFNPQVAEVPEDSRSLFGGPVENQGISPHHPGCSLTY